jgi:3'-phosphoadenosine 5'-phosphosulfate sulfotransferase (PAPS reductase)/FAD synthetase
MNAIQISGGVDSMAMLHHLRHLWDDSVVMWCDTGAAYAETRALMERVKKLVPRFRVVHGNQPEVIARAGFPVDVVPVRHSLQGELAYGPQVLKYQSYIDCCRQSIWEPLQRACLALGVDTIYRGQRRDDARRAPIASGHIDPWGVKIMFPIHEWTRDQVFAYVREHCPEWLARYYETEKTSRDCWDCTAYRDDNRKRVENLPADKRVIVQTRLWTWRRAVSVEMNLE